MWSDHFWQPDAGFVSLCVRLWFGSVACVTNGPRSFFSLFSVCMGWVFAGRRHAHWLKFSLLGNAQNAFGFAWTQRTEGLTDSLFTNALFIFGGWWHNTRRQDIFCHSIFHMWLFVFLCTVAHFVSKAETKTNGRKKRSLWMAEEVHTSQIACFITLEILFTDFREENSERSEK